MIRRYSWWLAIALTARHALTGLAALVASQRWRTYAARFGTADAREVVRLVEGAIDALAVAGMLGDLGGAGGGVGEGG